MGIDWSATQGGSAEIFVMHERVVSKEIKPRAEEVGKTFGEKQYGFWVETFFFYQKMRLHPLSSNLWT